MTTARMLDPIPPSEILMEEFMRPLGISINALARDLAVPANRISGIINRTRAITADTALRLGKHFGVSPEIWLDLQSDYELRVARQKGGLAWERSHVVKTTSAEVGKPNARRHRPRVRGEGQRRRAGADLGLSGGTYWLSLVRTSVSQLRITCNSAVGRPRSGRTIRNRRPSAVTS